LHANYSRKFKESQFSDEYLAHRMTQLFELGQFIQKTSHAADLVLLMGDLNTEESEDGFKMLVQHAGLVDAFKATNVGFFIYAEPKLYSMQISVYLRLGLSKLRAHENV
jgi:hypothetical protein